MKKTSEAQLRAVANWERKNIERKRYNSKKSACKNFILSVADADDLALVEAWLQEAKNNLKK